MVVRHVCELISELEILIDTTELQRFHSSKKTASKQNDIATMRWIPPIEHFCDMSDDAIHWSGR